MVDVKTKFNATIVFFVLLFSLVFVTPFFVGNVRAGSTYYVSTSGSDSAGDGSIGNPWATIKYATRQSTTAGDTIYVRAGTYNGFYGTSGFDDGTSASWLTLSAYPSGGGYENVIINRSFYDGYTTPPSSGYVGMFYFGSNDHKYINIRGFHFVNGTLLDYDEADTPDTCGMGIFMEGGGICHNITIEDCTFENISDSAIKFTTTDDVIVRNCTLYNICNYHGKYTAGQEGISLGDVKRFDISYNTIKLCYKINIDAKASSENGLIHNNDINVTHGNTAGLDLTWVGGGITIDAQTTYTNNVTIYNNRIWGNRTGITVSTEQGGDNRNTTIYNNIINCTGGASYPCIMLYTYNYAGASNVKDNTSILFNTLHGNTEGVYVNCWGWKVKGLVIANNIIDTQQTGGIDAIKYMNATTDATIVNNLFNASASDDWGIGSINASPSFVNPDTDFHLKATSNAIDAADSSYVSSIYATVTDDYDSVSRPQGDEWDIGAYEYIYSFTDIVIPSDSDFDYSHGVRYGDGTTSNPYMISNWTIYNLTIYDTTKNFTIWNCTFSYHLNITNVANDSLIEIIDVSLDGSDAGKHSMCWIIVNKAGTITLHNNSFINLAYSFIGW